MATLHDFKTDLASGEFTEMIDWIEEKYPKEATEILKKFDETPEETGDIYNAWILDQKITHTITEDGKVTHSFSYKEIE
jgi:hypothetical protein